MSVAHRRFLDLGLNFVIERPNTSVWFVALSTKVELLEANKPCEDPSLASNICQCIVALGFTQASLLFEKMGSCVS
jgi:hypothetical protein